MGSAHRGNPFLSRCVCLNIPANLLHDLLSFFNYLAAFLFADVRSNAIDTHP